MKEKGYKHEDELMKENAKLQVQKGQGIMNSKNRNESAKEDAWFIYLSLSRSKYNTGLRRLRD